jgi:hypothetical protein
MILMLTQRKLINEEQDEIISASPPSLPSPPSSTSSRSSTTHSQVLLILNVAGRCNPCPPLNFYLASSAIQVFFYDLGSFRFWDEFVLMIFKGSKKFNYRIFI